VTWTAASFSASRVTGADLEAASFQVEDAPAPIQTVTVTLSPASVEFGEEPMRDMGRLGPHLAGHYWLLGTGHYVWEDQGPGSFDPGAFDASLAGRAGIEVTLTASNRTAAQRATAVASAIDATPGLAAVADGASVTITGAGTASAGTRTWDDSLAGEGHGVLGMLHAGIVGINSFPAAQTSASLLDPTALPADPFIVTGFRVAVSDVHAAQLTVAVYQGGAADNDPEGAVLLGVAGVTTGSVTAANIYAGSLEPFEVDPGAGRVWVVWSHDVGAFEAAYPFDLLNPTQLAAITTSQWVITGGQGIYEMSGVPLSSDPEDWPAALTAVTGDTIAVPSIMLSWVSVAGFQCDQVATGRLGTRAAAADYTGTSGATLLVGNSHTSPAVLGMTVREAAVAYAAHASGNDYRLSLATGGAAANDFSGGTWADIGRAVGTATGWVTVTPAAGTVTLAASSRVWITIHHTTGASLLAFDPAAAPDIHSPAHDPAAYYGGGVTESEVDDGFLGGTPTTNASFDPAVALAGVITPDGTIYNNSNNVGVSAIWEVLGWLVA
jgi:hypothetical protein